MTPEDGKTLAEAVARALDLGSDEDRWWPNTYRTIRGGEAYLYRDGSNVFCDYWFKRCLLELLKRGWNIDQIPSATSNDVIGCIWKWTRDSEGHGLKDRWGVTCPPEEFPARALATLMKDRP